MEKRVILETELNKVAITTERAKASISLDLSKLLFNCNYSFFTDTQQWYHREIRVKYYRTISNKTTIAH